MYSIGTVSKMLNIPTTTLRYYDSFGFFPHIERTKGGTRIFSDIEIETLKIVDCLKISGMEMKDIKLFLQWCSEGDCSLEKRLNMFYQRKELVEEQLIKLERTLDIIKYKCWYYETAVEHKSESYVRSIPNNSIPDSIKKLI